MIMLKPVRALSLLSATLCCATTYAADPASSIDTVIVSASPITPEDKLATIVETVDRAEILRAGGATLADALANSPGVTGSGFASGASRPVIRGFDSNRVRILEDGVGSFDVADVGPDHGVPIDPLSAQRIEVIRGAATMRYGSQAIGGVVNAINNRVPLRLPDERVSAELTGLYGTNADTAQGSALIDAQLGAFAVHADGFRRSADDYDIPDGTMPNSFFRGDGYSLGSSYFFGKNRVGAAVVHYGSEYGIPGEENFIDMKQTKEMLRSSFAPGIGALHTITIDGGHADYEHSERDSAGVAQATFKDNEWDARAEALFDKVGPFSASALGIQMQNREFSALGEGADYLLPTETSTAAAFAFADMQLSPRLHLHAGARVESVELDGTPANDVPISRSFTPVSASAGLLFDFSDSLRLGLTFASAARAPGQTELLARGPHEGTATFETGDPTLDEERAHSLEATLRFDTGRVRIEGAVWGAKFSDYIYGNLTGRSCDDEGNCAEGDDGELRELFYEQRDAMFRGAEGKATVTLYDGENGPLRAIVLADYVRATLDGGGEVPRISPYHVGVGLDWDSPSLGGGFLLKYTGPREDNLATAETPTAGFVSLDAQATWRPFEESPDVAFSLVGRNLTDRTQRNAISLNKDEVVMPGRDLRLMVWAKF
ncbi:MAG TPA: TonB-dependent receptor [Steroidobacteraceae bacterium]|nr:TonB-dependent receptor [Steroidobacteraceae bacterium]